MDLGRPRLFTLGTPGWSLAREEAAPEPSEPEGPKGPSVSAGFLFIGPKLLSLLSTPSPPLLCSVERRKECWAGDLFPVAYKKIKAKR